MVNNIGRKTCRIDDKGQIYMSRVRTYRTQFCIISNESAQNCNLSFEALGLLTYCLSMPEEWEFKQSNIIKKRKCGKDKTQKLFNELIKNYRCIRIRKRDETKKTYACVSYEIFDDPEVCKKRIIEHELNGDDIDHGDKLKKCLPQPENPAMEPQPDFPQQENKAVVENILKNLDSREEKKVFKKFSPRKSAASPHITLKKETLKKKKESEKEKESDPSGSQTPPNGGPTPPFFSSSLQDKARIEYAPYVKLTIAEYQKLLDEFGPEKLKWCLDRLSDWCVSKAETDKKAVIAHTAFHRLKRWVSEEYEKEQDKQRFRGNKNESNLSFVKRFFKHGNFYNGAECFITENAIAFQRGMTYNQIKFSELGFRDQFDNLLRKFDIKIQKEKTKEDPNVA